jgi:site-specific recombinase XerD
MLIDTFIAEWKEHSLIQRGQQPRGVAQYERIIRGFFTWLVSRGFPANPAIVARDHITEWQRSIFYDSHNLSNRTRASKLSAVRSFFSYLVYSGEISHNPVKGVPSPKIQPKLAQKFTTEELRMIFSAPDLSTTRGVRDLAILKTMYATGARVSELTSIDIKRINDTGGYMRIAIVAGKGGKSRTLTLRRSASRTLREWLLIRRDIITDHDGVFVALNRAPYSRLSVTTIQNVIKKYSGMVGIKSVDAFCHKMRSTFATDLYDSGHDKCSRCGQPIQYIGLPELAVLMGHEDVKTTMGYIAISERVLRKTAIPDRRFSEIDGPEEEH